MEDNLILNR